MRPPSLFIAFSALLFGACYSAGDGEPPILTEIYFPTGLALDFVPNPDPSAQQAPDRLFVASSDFDLQYRASALASYNLDALSALLPQSCDSDADCANALGEGWKCDSAAPSDSLGPYNSGTIAKPVYLPSYFCVQPTANRLVTPCAAPKLTDGTSYDPGYHSPADQVLYPGRCASINSGIRTEVIASTVEIGAFATDAIFKPTGVPDPIDPQKPNVVPDPVDNVAFKGRLFVPVRGDATLHWIDVEGAGTAANSAKNLELYCGQQNTSDGSCDDAHRIGDDEYEESQNLLRQEPEPFAIAVDDNGKHIAITNQTTGSVSLYVNHWGVTAQNGAIKLVDLLVGLPTAPVGIAALPTPLQLDQTYQPGFLAVYSDAAQVDLLRVESDTGELPTPVAPDAGTGPAEDYQVQVLTRAASVAITTNSNGTDSRGIAIDDSQRKADYEACMQPYPGCSKDVYGNYPTGSDLTKCACPQTPGDALNACKAVLQTCLQSVHQPSVFVANRTPASLVVGAFTPNSAYAAGTSELPAFSDSIPMNLGPSRIVVGRVKVRASATSPNLPPDRVGPYAFETRVFVVCFDSRKIYIYDPARHVIDSIVSTGRGPYAFVVDEQRGLGYVAHFTDSYLGVISLDQRFPQNYASIIASIGVPTAPRASK